MTCKKAAAGFTVGGILLIAALWAAVGVASPPPLLDGVPTAHVVLDREGSLLRMGLSEDEKYRIHIPLEAVSPKAIDAVLLYEDRYFYSHCGINPVAMLRAALTWFTGGRRSGASTLTMQVARLRFGLSTGSWSGKLRQIWLALRLERHYSKHEILEAYFNLAPYGGNIEGIEAAARIYFHKPAFRLTTQEVLALTVVPQNPSRRNPLTGKGFEKARALLAGIWQQTYDEADLDATVYPLRIFTPADIPFEAPHATSELLATQKESRITSSLSLKEQKLIEDHLRLFAARGKTYGLTNAAAILVHAPTREIRALAGSADFFSAAIQGQVDGTKAKRSPGSTLKPFIYALALDQGLIHPMSLLIDSPRSFGGYDPENFDKGFRGPLSAKEALRTSRNLPAISLAQQLKDPDLYDFLQRTGVVLPQTREHYGLSLVLGGAEVSMRELAALYAVLVNEGLYAPLRLTRENRENNSAAVMTSDDQRRVFSREACFITLDMLKRQDVQIKSKGQSLPLCLKTGTSNGFRDAWTAGVMGDYVLIVWVGNFDNTANPLFVGAEAAQPLFTDIAEALAGKLALQKKIPSQDLNLVRIPVCAATGDTDTSLCPDTAETWFIPGVSPVRNTGIYREVLIDKATGLRACVPHSEKTRFEVSEFWPGNLRRIFAQAGLEKQAPPDWLPECRPADPDTAGTPPVILSPKPGVVYHVQLSAPGKSQIPLSAGVAPGGTRLFWFAGDRLLGESGPDETLLWTPDPGRYELRCTDNLGRTTRRTLDIRAAR